MARLPPPAQKPGAMTALGSLLIRANDTLPTVPATAVGSVASIRKCSRCERVVSHNRNGDAVRHKRMDKGARYYSDEWCTPVAPSFACRWTHTEMNAIACLWLIDSGCDSEHIFADHPKVPSLGWRPDDGERPDAIGWTPQGISIVVESKTSASDLRNDKKKRCRAPGRGMGDLRYLLAPRGLAEYAVEQSLETHGWGVLSLGSMGHCDIAVIKQSAVFTGSGVDDAFRIVGKRALVSVLTTVSKIVRLALWSSAAPADVDGIIRWVDRIIVSDVEKQW